MNPPHSRRPLRSIRAAALARLLVAVPAVAGPPATMSFRNNLSAGFLTQHTLARTYRRTVAKPVGTETVVYSRSSTWVHCNVDESRPGQMKVYQMITDAPPKVLKFFRAEKELPAPSAAALGLAEGATALFDDITTPRDANIQTPRTDPAERVLLAALLDVAHWPSGPIAVGHRWQRDLAIENFSGTQTFEFLEVKKINGETCARLSLTVDGAFAGPMEKEFTLKKLSADLLWSRADRCLRQLDGQAVFHRKRDAGVEDYDLKVTLRLADSRVLSDEGQAEILRQLNAFASALTELNAGRRDRAAAACETFRARWPDSLWRPAVNALHDRATRVAKAAPRLNDREIDDALAKAFLAWQAAVRAHDDDLRDRTRKGLARIADDYRPTLKNLLASKDESVRARAAFASAFGARPADLAVTQKALADESVQVRALALMGLAARKSTETDAKRLAALLADPDKSIRRLACDTIAACIAREDPAVAGLIETLGKLLQHDKAAGVRQAAAGCIAALGAPADVPLLEKALRSEAETPVREEIQRAIEALKNGK